jgi:hypothetical protein
VATLGILARESGADGEGVQRGPQAAGDQVGKLGIAESGGLLRYHTAKGTLTEQEFQELRDLASIGQPGYARISSRA